MLKIWGRANSSNVQKVLWTCEEIGIKFDRIDAGGSFGKTNEPAYLKMNPNGLVPTVEDGDTIIWESNTIMRYLAGKHGAANLYPADLVRRIVRVKEAEAKLSPKEYDILRQLVLHAGKVLTHKHLLREVWGPATADVQYLRIYIRQLRQKLEADPERPQLIITEPAVGYRLVVPP